MGDVGDRSIRGELQYVDDGTLRTAETDVARALIVQNARIARRGDPFGRHRTRALEGRLVAPGVLLSAVGAAASLWWLFASRRGGGVPIAVFAAFLTSGVIFRFLRPLRAAAIRHLDASLRRSARRTTSSVRPRSQLRYSIGDSLRCEDVEVSPPQRRFDVPLAELRYALAGEASLVLFRRRSALRVRAVVFGRHPTLEGALADAGVEIEALSRDLLPDTTTPRSW